MSSSRVTSVSVGFIFIVATVAALAAAMVVPVLTGPTFLVALGANPGSMAPSAVLYIVAALTSASIPIVLYPLLQKSHPALAMASVIFRGIEAVFYLVAVLGLLSVVTLSQDLASATGDRGRDLYGLAHLFLKLRDHASLLGVIAFCTGSLMYYWVFFRTRLVPRWLSVWGLAAAVLMLVACGLSLVNDDPITGYTLLVLPIALQEMVLAFWLLIKGFREESRA